VVLAACSNYQNGQRNWCNCVNEDGDIRVRAPGKCYNRDGEYYVRTNGACERNTAFTCSDDVDCDSIESNPCSGSCMCATSGVNECLCLRRIREDEFCETIGDM